MNTYNLTYLIAKWYLIIAGINWMIAWLVVSIEWKHYIEQINTLPVNNTFVRFVIFLLVPVVYGLGWVFFIPGVLCTAIVNYKNSK